MNNKKLYILSLKNVFITAYTKFEYALLFNEYDQCV